MNEFNFYKQLEQDKIKFEGQALDFDVVLDKSYEKVPEINLYKNKFSGSIYIEDINLSGPISFSYCEFAQGIHFRNVKNTTGKPLTISFIGCKLTGFSLSNVAASEKILIVFERTDNQDPISIRESQLEEIRIEGGVWLDNFITDVKVKELTWKNNTSRSFEFIGVNASGIEFRNITLSQREHGGVLFRHMEVIQFYISEVESEVSVLIDNCRFEDMQISNCKGQGQLRCLIPENPVSRSALLVSHCSFEDGISIEGSVENQNKQVPDLTLLEIRCDGTFKSRLTVEDLDLHTFNLFGFNPACSIQVNGSRINTVQFWHLINNNDLLLTNLKALTIGGSPSRFIINQSKLGRAHLYNVDLGSFDKFIYKDSDISEISTSHVTWFNGKDYSQHLKIGKKISEENKNKLRESFKRQRDLFRQLKVVMDRQGDKAYALEFFKWEMWNYKKVVKLRGTIWDRFVLLIGQTNDYGNNWLKPLLILGLLNTLIYIPVALLSSNDLGRSISFASADLSKSWSVICESVRYWFILLNPAHSLDRMFANADKLSWMIYLLDLLARVVASLFIYQIIVAFRKYYRQ